MTDTTLASLRPDPNNARRHTPRNVGMIETALREVGAARSIVIDEDGVILAGNATRSPIDPLSRAVAMGDTHDTRPRDKSSSSVPTIAYRALFAVFIGDGDGCPKVVLAKRVAGKERAGVSFAYRGATVLGGVKLRRGLL